MVAMDRAPTLDEVAVEGQYGTLRKSLENWWLVVKQFDVRQSADDQPEMEWAAYAYDQSGRSTWMFETETAYVYRKRKARKIAKLFDATIVNAADWWCRLPDEYRHQESRDARERT